MKIYKGTILQLSGSWGSGLAMLDIADERRGHIRIPCENGPAVRALDDCFGGVIGPGHTILPEGGCAGKEIYYFLDDIGLLSGFSPVDGAPDEIVEEYEKAARKRPSARKAGNTHLGFAPPDDPIYGSCRRIIRCSEPVRSLPGARS
jgi:hypothetical protein